MAMAAATFSAMRASNIEWVHRVRMSSLLVLCVVCVGALAANTVFASVSRDYFVPESFVITMGFVAVVGYLASRAYAAGGWRYLVSGEKLEAHADGAWGNPVATASHGDESNPDTASFGTHTSQVSHVSHASWVSRLTGYRSMASVGSGMTTAAHGQRTWESPHGDISYAGPPAPANDAATTLGDTTEGALRRNAAAAKAAMVEAMKAAEEADAILYESLGGNGVPGEDDLDGASVL
jgi:hypothetical protein